MDYVPDIWVREENELFKLNGYERFGIEELPSGTRLVRAWRRLAPGEAGSSNVGIWDALKHFNTEPEAKGFLTKIARAINATA